MVNGLLRSLFGAAGEVDGCAGGVEKLCEFISDTLVCACDEEDFVGLGADVFFGEGGGWGEVLRPV